MVMTDYEGLGTKGPHPYLNGEAEARDVLDMMRAARELLNVDGRVVLSDRFAIVGHSQGGHAALFAASTAATWTPELKLEGVAAIAPASRLTNLPLLAVGPPADRPFLALSLLGALRGGPTIDLNSILTPAGLKLFQETIDTQCRVELSEPSSWARLLPGLFNLLGDWGKPPSEFWKQLDEMDPVKPALTIDVPIRLSQAVNDERVNVEGTRALFQALQAPDRPSRVPVDYKEYDENNPVATPDPAKLGAHFGILITDIDPLVQWLEQIFKQLSISKENVA